MPYFDFLNEPNIRRGTAGFGLLALMLYPAEEERQLEWMTASITTSLTKVMSTGVPPSWEERFSSAESLRLFHSRNAAPSCAGGVSPRE